MAEGIRVWDPLVRLCHWSIALGVLLGWWSRDGRSALHEWHLVIGYTVLATVGVRLAWGLTSANAHVRLASMLQRPAAVRDYLKALWQGRAPRHLGHNPAGASMALVLWALLIVISGSGWLYTTDAYWGVEWVGQVHLYSTWALLALLPVHLAGVALSSWAHRENLVRAMLDGRKRWP